LGFSHLFPSVAGEKAGKLLALPLFLSYLFLLHFHSNFVDNQSGTQLTTLGVTG
jgi:hypothetical protein